MSASTRLHSPFRYKAWANEELFAGLEKLDPVTHQAERHSAIRLLNHIYTVGRIFAAHLAGTTHAYTATHGGYHRGGVGRIMAQASVPPPRDIFTVFLHTSEPRRRAG